MQLLSKGNRLKWSRAVPCGGLDDLLSASHLCFPRKWGCKPNAIKIIICAAAVALTLATSPSITAQTATGSITGTVSDSSGAVVPQVKVTVKSETTGTSRETQTTDSGDYSFSLLPVGRYSITSNQTGFQSIEQTGIQLNVDQVVRVNLTLKVGTASETVTVQAAAATIDTETSSIGQVINDRQVTQLPLNGRNFLQLIFLGAGAVQPPGGEQGSQRQGVIGAISINGSRPTSNNYLLDGMANTDTSLGTPAVVLSVDAIQEFKQQTATYSAEYGFSANQINIISKSGSNDLHGALFEFNRNNFFDARSFFQAQVPPLRQNQFGFVAGGPVYIPKLYNGKNKTFWLANYEGSRTRAGSDSFSLVPTPQQLSGVFTTTIINPATNQPFPNNTVPTTSYSRLAQLAVRKFFPAPNINALQGNYRFITSTPTDVDQQTYRLDQSLGRWGTIFGRGTYSKFTNTTPFGSVSAPIGNVSFNQDTTNWAVSHTITLGPTKVNQFRFGYLEALANQGGYPADPADISALGFSGVFGNLADGQRVYPSIAFSRGGYAGSGGAVNAYIAGNQPLWDFADSFTWVRGNHTLGFGIEYRRWRLQRDLANNFLGNFTFSGDFTGNPVADMLLGYYSQVGVFQPAGTNAAVVGNPREYNLSYIAPYFQDDWKVNQRLTLNLGLRWDFRRAPYETNDHFAWLDVTNPRGGLCVADQTLVSRGVTGDNSYYRYCGRRNPADASLTPFAPRIGFAYRPFGGTATVVRGGYGIFWDTPEGRELDGSADIYPYVSRGQYTQTIGQPTPLQTTNSLFPVFSVGRADPSQNTFIAVIGSESPRTPYVQQWSFSVQHQVTNSTTLEVNYIGNKGTHLLNRRNINQAYPPTNPANPTSVVSRRPYPNFVTYIDSDFSGNSSYNSLNTKLEHRSNSLAATVVYTWAKSIDLKSAAAGVGAAATGWQGFLDNHDVRRDRGLSDFDVNHRVVASVVYDLPFGKGKKFMTNSPGIVNAVLGNWQVNGIGTFQKGFPYPIFASDLGGTLDSFQNRANISGNPYPDGFNQTISKWFNTAAFTQPAAGVFGNSGRNILRAPGLNNFDLSLFKNFPIKERVNLQLRLESFNAMNRAQWSTPQNNVTSQQYGQITGTSVAGRINQLGAKFTW